MSNKPRSTAPIMFEEVVLTTVLTRVLNNPPKVKRIRIPTPTREVIIPNFILSRLYSTDFLYSSSVTTPTNLFGIASLFLFIEILF